METEQESQPERPLTRFDTETITVEFRSEPDSLIIPWSRVSGRPMFFSQIETYSYISKPNLTEYFFDPEPNIFKNQETCSICFGEFEDLTEKSDENKLNNQKN